MKRAISFICVIILCCIVFHSCATVLPASDECVYIGNVYYPSYDAYYHHHHYHKPKPKPKHHYHKHHKHDKHYNNPPKPHNTQPKSHNSRSNSRPSRSNNGHRR